MLAQPRNDLGGILVRRKHRIEHLADDAVVDDKRHALEQRHAGNGERGELHGAGEGKPGIGEDRERQVQALGGLALIVGVLRREPEQVGNAEPIELGEMVAKAAGLGGAAARAGNIVPPPGGRSTPGTPVRG
jgi:hypothetical protein